MPGGASSEGDWLCPHPSQAAAGKEVGLDGPNCEIGKRQS